MTPSLYTIVECSKRFVSKRIRRHLLEIRESLRDEGYDVTYDEYNEIAITPSIDMLILYVDTKDVAVFSVASTLELPNTIHHCIRSIGMKDIRFDETV